MLPFHLINGSCINGGFIDLRHALVYPFYGSGHRNSTVHVYPALAIGEALQSRGHELCYFGDPNRLEGRVVPPTGIDFHAVKALQFPRKGLLSKVKFGFGLLSSILHSRRELKTVGADIVLGVGGYISAPPVLAAASLGIPTAIHEANVTPGLANRLCAIVAKLVLLTYAQTATRLGGNAPRETVGCPVNETLLGGNRTSAAKRYGLDPNKQTLLVVGGSLGAKTINALGLAISRAASDDLQVLLVTGPTLYDEVCKEVGEGKSGLVVVGYEDRMIDAYAVADLVLARAGSSTLAELSALGKPSALVPSPNVTDNHQEGNARGLETVGASIVFTEPDLVIETAVDRILRLLCDKVALATMSEAARAQGKLGTAKRVAKLLESQLS